MARDNKIRVGKDGKGITMIRVGNGRLELVRMED